MDSYQKDLNLSNKHARLHLCEMPVSNSIIHTQLSSELHNLSKYPDPTSPKEREIISDYLNVDISNVVLGNGSDELILLVLLTWGLNQKVLLPSHTYPGYLAATKLSNSEVVEIPPKNWKVDIDGMCQMLSNEVGCAIICNPHNPFGTTIDFNSLERFVDECSLFNTIPIIDEAYIDFSSCKQSSLDLLKKNKRLIMLRTFSKGYGAAGLRVGYGVGSKHLIEQLIVAYDALPFSVNRISQQFVQSVFQQKQFYSNVVRESNSRKLHFSSFLSELGVWHLESDANFIFMEAPKSRSFSDAFEEGFVIRDCSSVKLPGYWRVSIGDEREMNRLTDWLSSIKN